MPQDPSMSQDHRDPHHRDPEPPLPQPSKDESLKDEPPVSEPKRVLVAPDLCPAPGQAHLMYEGHQSEGPALQASWAPPSVALPHDTALPERAAPQGLPQGQSRAHPPRAAQEAAEEQRAKADEERRRRRREEWERQLQAEYREFAVQQIGTQQLSARMGSAIADLQRSAEVGVAVEAPRGPSPASGGAGGAPHVAADGSHEAARVARDPGAQGAGCVPASGRGLRGSGLRARGLGRDELSAAVCGPTPARNGHRGPGPEICTRSSLGRRQKCLSNRQF